MKPTQSRSPKGGISRALSVLPALLLVMTLTGLCQSVQRPTDNDPPYRSILKRYGSYLTPNRELAGLRSLTSLHYRIDDRTNIALIGSRPLTFIDRGGRLEPISNTIVPDDERASGGYRFRNEANDVLFYFSADAARCSMLDAEGNELAVITSPSPDLSGTVSIAGSQIERSIDQDSSEFVWTVGGSALTYRWTTRRKIPIDSLGALVTVEWREAVRPADRSVERWQGGSMSLSILEREGSQGERLWIEEYVATSETSTTLLGSLSVEAGSSGTLRHYSGAVSRMAGSSMRLQNLSDPGCVDGYRAWARYDLSGLRVTDRIDSVEQHLYVADCFAYWYDPVDLDVMHLEVDPQSASAQQAWDAMAYGPRYISDYAVLSTGWRTIEMPAAAIDLPLSIASPGRFDLGYMVWCREDNSDYYIIVGGTGTANAPYLVVQYSPGTDVSEHDNLPGRFSLEQNYPNPFNPVTTIKYELPMRARVRLSVYNLLGEEVSVLVDGMQEAGYQQASFDAGNLPSGVYVCRITAGTFTDVKKMMLVK